MIPVELGGEIRNQLLTLNVNQRHLHLVREPSFEGDDDRRAV